jgi:hypothetical protein
MNGELVIDPGLPADERRRLARKAKTSAHEGIVALAHGVGMISVFFLVVTFILVFADNISWWWPIGGLVSVFLCNRLAGVGGTPTVSERDEGHCVAVTELNAKYRKLFSRSQQAISVVLGSDVYSDDLLGQAADENVLRRHEWEIAVALREITRLGATLDSNTGDGPPGPQTAAILDSHKRALKVALEAIRSRVTALERFAEQVEAADNAKLDWKRAMKVSDFNEKYRELVARTAADELAVAQLAEMTDQAATAAQTFNESLHQAALAAEALALPAR